MRKFIAILGVALLGALGCRHVGGRCDCGPVPGEATLYAPLHGYPAPAKETIPAAKEKKKVVEK